MSSSSATLGAAFLKSLGGRTFFSPGYGTTNPVLMYQLKWLTVSGSSASGLVSLPAKICCFFLSHATLRALTFFAVVCAAAAVAVVLTPWSSGIWFATCVHGWKFSAGGTPLTNAVVIGDATRSNWFMGGKPRICSIVRVMLTCV